MAQVEAKTIELEMLHFKSEFKEKIAALNQAGTDENALLLKNDLLEEIKSSNCQFCRTQVSDALESFNISYKNAQHNKAMTENKALLQKIQDVAFMALKREHCFDTWYTTQFNDSVQPPPHIEMLKSTQHDLRTKRHIIEEFAKLDFLALDLATLVEYNQNITDLTEQIEQGYKSLCAKLPVACECK